MYALEGDFSEVSSLLIITRYKPKGNSVLPLKMDLPGRMRYPQELADHAD
jgi:hypothetical protein